MEEKLVKEIPVILICEDLPDHSETLIKQLKSQINREIEVISVSSGVDVKLIKDKNKNLIKTRTWIEIGKDGKKDYIENIVSPSFYIFDFRLPGLNGLQIWEKIGKPTKYVFYTIWAFDNETLKVMEKNGVSKGRVITKMGKSLENVIQPIITWMKKDNIL